MHIRKTLTALLIGSAIILPTANGALIELITNGDFATEDFTGWAQEILGQQTIENGAARLNNNTGGAGSSIIRQNQIQAGGFLHPDRLFPSPLITVALLTLGESSLPLSTPTMRMEA